MTGPSRIDCVGRVFYILQDVHVRNASTLTLMSYDGPEYYWSEWHQLSSLCIVCMFMVLLLMLHL